MSTNLKSQTVRGVAWSFVERFSVQGVQFFLGIIIARLLSPHDYGIIGMLAIFMAISQVFIDGGFSSALVQKKDRNAADFSTVFYINLLISVLCYLLLFVFAPVIATFYDEPLLTSITRVYALNLILNSLVAVNRTKLVIAVDFKTQSKISLNSAILSGIIGLSFAWYGFGVWSLVAQMIASSILNVVLSFYYVRWLPDWIFSRSSFQSLFAYGSKLLVASLISSVYTQLYALVIGKKFSATSLGYYTRANQFAEFTTNNIAGILSRVSFPIFSQIQDDDKRLVSVYSKYIQMSALIVFPLILGLCGVAKPLITLLLTEKWIDCAILLQILCFAYLWNCIIIVNINLLNVKGRTDLVLKLEIAKKTVAFTILFISLFFDLIGICIGLVIYSLIAFYMNTYYTKKMLDYGFMKQLKDLLPYLILSLIVMCEALFFSHYIQNVILSLSLSIIVCVVTYITLSYIMNLNAFFELLKIICKGK